MAWPCGKNLAIQKISNRFFLHNIKGDVEEFIKKCDQCQKQGKIKNLSSKLHSIPIKTEIMHYRLVSIYVAFLKLMVSRI